MKKSHIIHNAYRAIPHNWLTIVFGVGIFL